MSKAKMRDLREHLHYWQERAVIEARGLRATRALIKEIAAQMRALQKEGKGRKRK